MSRLHFCSKLLKIFCVKSKNHNAKKIINSHSQILPLYSAKSQSKSHKFPIFQSLKFKVWILQCHWGLKAPSRARRAPRGPKGPQPSAGARRMYFDVFLKIELPVAFFEARTSFMPYNITQEHGLLKKDIIFIITAIYTLKTTIFVAYIFKYLRKRGKLDFFFKKMVKIAYFLRTTY